MSAHKLSYQRGDATEVHSYPPWFRVETAEGGTERLVTGASGNDALVFTRLLECIEPPYYVLYLLHTPRGEGEQGRYQSNLVEQDEFRTFMARFERYLSGDARHDFWVHSPSDGATLVWERHNLIYAYGKISCYTSALRSLGFNEGDIQIPIPHTHHYRVEFDADAMAILSALHWNRTPLQPQDEQ